MLKDYLKYLVLVCKKFAKQHDIFDIVLYGSAIKGKEEPCDIDILLIFQKIKLKKRTDIAQQFKGVLKKKIKKVDIKTINLSELFEKEFLARQGIFIEGYSLLYDVPISKRFGFGSYVLFTYGLKNLNHGEKTKFTYALIGRKRKGIIEQLDTKHLGKGVVIVPINNSLIFEAFLQRWEVSYKKKNILISLL